MAIYHFTVNKDKKPDGTKVKAVEHVAYINREGKYKDVDKAPDNFIAIKGAPPLYDGKVAMLYESPYGNITTTPQGLKVDGNASPTTIAIAMMIASDVSKGKVELRGSDRFKSRAICAAAESDLDVTLEDDALQGILLGQKEKMRDERRKYREAGGRILKPAGTDQHDAYGDSEAGASLSQIISIRQIPGMQEMSQRHLDRGGQEEPELLLQPDARDELEDIGADADSPVRRYPDGDADGGLTEDEKNADTEDTDNPAEMENQPMVWVDRREARRHLAEEFARRILKNVERVQDHIFAESHLEYINREKAFARKGGCVYSESYLPEWAEGSPNTFFKMADRHSKPSVIRYLEFQFALPNELDMEQCKELIHTFIQRSIPNHYYNFAIHDKIGAMSDGCHNLHCHLMFSDRIVDDVEKEKPRKPKNYFRRPNPNARTFEEKWESGAPKERRFSDRGFFREIRKLYEDTANEILEKYGKADRIDCRSLKDMKKEAQMNGDDFMLKALDRMPERSLGPRVSLIENNPEIRHLQEQRKLRRERNTLLYNELLTTEEIKDLELKETHLRATLRVNDLIKSQDYEAIDALPQDDYRHELKDVFEDAKKEVSRLFRSVEWTDELVTQNLVKCLNNEDDREAVQAQKEQEKELEHWENFTDSIDIDAEPEYAKLLPLLNRKIRTLRDGIKARKPQIDAIMEKVNQPDQLDILQRAVNRGIMANRRNKTALQHACEHLENARIALEQAMQEDRESALLSQKETYTTKELYDILRKRVYGYRKEYKRAQARVRKLRKQVIPMERAMQIAENQYVGGEWKTWRKDMRELNKQLQYLDNDRKALAADKEKLTHGLLPFAQRNALAEDIQKRQKDIDIRTVRLHNQKEKLTSQQAALRTRCDTPEAKAKIQEIALGIIRKNQPKKRLYDAAVKQMNAVQAKWQEAQKQLDAVRLEMGIDGNHTAYKVTPSGGSDRFAHDDPKSLDIPFVIAEAIAGDNEAGAVVLRCQDEEDPRLRKDWKFMNVFDREEEERKALLRTI